MWRHQITRGKFYLIKVRSRFILDWSSILQSRVPGLFIPVWRDIMIIIIIIIKCIPKMPALDPSGLEIPPSVIYLLRLLSCALAVFVVPATGDPQSSGPAERLLAAGERWNPLWMRKCESRWHVAF